MASCQACGERSMRLKNGIELLDECEGVGAPADKGDRIIYNLRIFLNKGDEVLLNERQAEHLPEAMIRTKTAIAL